MLKRGSYKIINQVLAFVKFEILKQTDKPQFEILYLRVILN